MTWLRAFLAWLRRRWFVREHGSWEGRVVWVRRARRWREGRVSLHLVDGNGRTVSLWATTRRGQLLGVNLLEGDMEATFVPPGAPPTPPPPGRR